MSTSSVAPKTLQSVRIQKEILSLQQKPKPYIVSYKKPQTTKEIWIFKLKPAIAPYLGILTLQIDCTGEYPFRAPSVTFTHPIHHPNVTNKGEVCLTMLSYENWKPGTTMHSIILSILSILAEPDLARPVRWDVADEYIHRRKEFNAKAAELTTKHSTQ